MRLLALYGLLIIICISISILSIVNHQYKYFIIFTIFTVVLVNRFILLIKKI